MVQIFDSLKALIAPELSKAATALGEQEERVSTASTGILAGILAKLLHKGATPQVESALKDAGKADCVAELGSLFSGRGTVAQENTGNKFLQAILGDKASDFSAGIAKEAGLNQSSVNKLTTMIASVTAGFLGHKVVNGSMKTSDIITELGAEKNRFMGFVPASVKNLLGVNGKYSQQPEKKKSSYSWLIWLLLAIALILLIVFGWRSCRDRDTVNAFNDNHRSEEIRSNVQAAAANETLTASSRNVREMSLPNGVKIQGYENSVEQKMIAFLNSNGYKNANADADLSKNWFEFEDIDFKRGSATELDPSATVHVNNVIAILKAYPEAKIKIGGNADKTGTRSFNMELSKERANTMKSMLVKGGIASSRISTEGFGEENATWPETATAEQSAPDRDIAFRFTK